MSIDNVSSDGILFQDVSATLNGLALDLDFDSRVAYITDPGKDGMMDGKIYRANLDGAVTVTDLTPQIGQMNLKDPEGIALDLRYRRIFWTDSGNKTKEDGRVYRCKLDGSKVEVVVSKKLTDPQGLALDLQNN